MITSLFEIIGMDTYPIWGKTEDGRYAPMRELMLKNVTEDPIVDEVMCVVYGNDAIKSYEFGECILATLEFFVGYNDDESCKQVIRARGVSKINLPLKS